jgi:hypothetical protein
MQGKTWTANRVISLRRAAYFSVEKNGDWLAPRTDIGVKNKNP